MASLPWAVLSSSDFPPDRSNIRYNGIEKYPFLPACAHFHGLHTAYVDPYQGMIKHPASDSQIFGVRFSSFQNNIPKNNRGHESSLPDFDSVDIIWLTGPPNNSIEGGNRISNIFCPAVY